MKVVILHEDLEWAEKEMAEQLRDRGIQARLYDVRNTSVDDILDYEPSFVLNRVYASVANRNYPALVLTLDLLGGLESKNVSVINSLVTTRADYFKDVAVRMDKESGLLVPTTRIFRNLDDALGITEELGYPIIAKRNTGGRAVDLAKIDNFQQLKSFVKGMKRYGGEYILQEFLHSSYPYDFRVTVINNEIAFAYNRTLVAKGDETPWLASVSNGSKRVVCSVSTEISDVAIRAAASIGAFFDSLDLVVTSDGVAIIEHNPTPNYSAKPEDISESRHFINQALDSLVSLDLKDLRMGENKS